MPPDSTSSASPGAKSLLFWASRSRLWLLLLLCSFLFLSPSCLCPCHLFLFLSGDCRGPTRSMTTDLPWAKTPFRRRALLAFDGVGRSVRCERELVLLRRPHKFLNTLRCPNLVSMLFRLPEAWPQGYRLNEPASPPVGGPGTLLVGLSPGSRLRIQPRLQRQLEVLCEHLWTAIVAYVVHEVLLQHTIL